MVDTMVLVYAMQSASAATTVDAKNLRTSARALLDSLDKVRVSAVTWVEFMPNVKEQVREKNKDLLDKFEIVALDPAGAREAERLLVKYRERPKACPSCLGAIGIDVPCKKCGLHSNRQLRLNDIFIVATAVSDPDTDTLYSYDGGVLHFADKVSGCRIARPPSAHGPLFEHPGELAEVIGIDRAKGKPDA